MRCLILLFTLAVSSNLSLALDIDQRSSQLDALFAKLQSKDNTLEMYQTEQKIWDLWMQSDSSEEDLLLADATQDMSLGNFDKCEAKLNRLIARDANFAEAWNKRATLYYLMGRLDDSLSDIVKTLELEPRHFGALSGRGMIYMKQYKLPEALKAYREAWAINPHMPGVKAAMDQLEMLVPDL